MGPQGLRGLVGPAGPIGLYKTEVVNQPVAGPRGEKGSQGPQGPVGREGEHTLVVEGEWTPKVYFKGAVVHLEGHLYWCYPQERCPAEAKPEAGSSVWEQLL